MEVEVASEGRGDEEGQAEGRVERQGDGAAPPPVAEASNLPLPRLRSRSLLAPRLSLFLSKAGKSKAKSLTTASRIAKRFEQTPRRQSVERKQRDEAPAKTASVNCVPTPYFLRLLVQYSVVLGKLADSSCVYT